MIFDILNQVEEQVIIGSGSFKNKRAKITDKNSGYIFSLLSKIYSNPIGSIVREVTSNCFDAHMKAARIIENIADQALIDGKSDIEINEIRLSAYDQRTYPVYVRHYIDESGQNYIEFVDKGTGISPELMDEVFMSYGESDKRDSDEFIGAYGIGSKAPFSYSDHFYVFTVVGGIKYHYLLNETPVSPEYDLLFESETKETNGTTIRVPFQAEDFDKFQTNITNQLRYFKNVFVVGFPKVNNEYKIHSFKTFQVRDDIFKANPNNKLHIALGDVYYPLDLTLLDQSGLPESYGFNGALTFEIGELKVTPNRESLEYNEKTKNAVLVKLEAFLVEIKELILDNNNFVSKSILGYRNDLASLENGIILLKNIIPDQEIPININTMGIFKKDDVNYTFKLNDYRMSVAIKYITPTSHVKPILMRSNSGKLTKYKSNGTNSLKEVFVQNTGKYIVIPKDKIKLKVSERAYLNEKVKTSRVLYFDEKEFMKKFIKHISIFEKDGTQFNYEKLTYAELVGLVREFKKQWKSQIFDINFNYLSEFNIPFNYGREKRQSNALEKGTILSYILSSRNYFERCDYTVKNLTEELTTGRFKDSILIYTDRTNKWHLSNTVYNFEKLLFNNYKADKKLIVAMSCARCYHKFLEKMPNTIDYDLMLNQKENSLLVQQPEVLKVLTDSFNDNEMIKLLNSVNYDLKYEDLDTIKINSKSSDIIKEFEGLLLKKYWSQIPTGKAGSVNNAIIHQLLSDKFVDKLRLKSKSIFDKSKNSIDLWKELTNHFLLELKYFYEDLDNMSINYEILANSLNAKKHKIEELSQQIKTKL